MNDLNPEQQQLALPQVSTTTRHKIIQQRLEEQFIYNRSDRPKEEFQEEQQRLVQVLSDLRGRQGDLSRNIVQNITTQRQQLEQSHILITSNEINQTSGQQMLNQLQSTYDKDSIALQNRQTEEATRLQVALNEAIRCATQKQMDHLNEYILAQSSIEPPTDYEELNPSALPRPGSDYYQRLRSKGESISIPYSHEKLVLYELLFRGIDLKCGALRVNGVTMKYKFTIDMWSANHSNNFVSLIEDDGIKHVCDSRYYTQVARDKYVMECLSRAGKIPLLLRYLHSKQSTNRVPDDLIPWFIQLMLLTDFDGATGSVVALVSIGRVHKRWYPKIRQVANTFSGKGGCSVKGYELYLRDGGRPAYRIVDYSNPAVLQELMVDYGVDWTAGK